MKTTINSTFNAPSAFITKNKKRIKQYENSVYLNNGDEFEIELFNPTQNKILAKIEINGNNIGGNGIVLRPGQRVFLERYLNDDKKFLFETYKVNGNDSLVKKAIEKNGDISIKFYQEQLPSYTYGSLTTATTSYYTPYTFTNTVGTTNNFFSHSTPININSGSSTVTTFTNTVGTPKMKKLSLDKPKEIETGRIEKGSISNQSFTYDYSQFYHTHSWMNNWKLLPNSQKPITNDDIKVFCSNCGTRRKKDTHQFCPNCGTKYSIKNETEIVFTNETSYFHNGKHYFMSTFNTTLVDLMKKYKNKLIVINKNSLTENKLNAIIID